MRAFKPNMKFKARVHKMRADGTIVYSDNKFINSILTFFHKIKGE